MIAISQTIEDGIEHIVYTPDEKRFETPIIMQHGMWHGAWGWQPWQELLAEWGWESHAHSLPGHGRSPTQRPIRWCTLGYYLEFLVAEIKHAPHPPVLMGHSMGGALAQMVLKNQDDLAAVVMVAPWKSHSMVRPILRTLQRDLPGFIRSTFHLTTTPLVRNSYRAAQMFITEGALLSPEELYEKLGPESMWVLFQYTPPLWRPAKRINTPMLWLAGEADTLIREWEQKQSAAYYGADYVLVEDVGHDIMLEKSSRDTAVTIHNWLTVQNIP